MLLKIIQEKNFATLSQQSQVVTAMAVTLILECMLNGNYQYTEEGAIYTY